MANTSYFWVFKGTSIIASRRYYAFDLVPAFWNALVVHANTGQIKSIDRVKDEISRGGADDLSAWVNGDFHHAFHSTNDSEVLARYAEIIVWSQNQNQYSLAENADLRLVAYAPLFEDKTGIDMIVDRL